MKRQRVSYRLATSRLATSSYGPAIQSIRHLVPETLTTPEPERKDHAP